MKILFISMISIHAVRWIENLKDSPFELYWYDILDRGNLPTTCELTQFYSLKKRKIAYFKGEYFLRKKNYLLSTKKYNLFYKLQKTKY